MKVVMISAGGIRGFSTSLRALNIAIELVQNYNLEVDLIVARNREDIETFGKNYRGVNIWYAPTKFYRCYSHKYDPLVLWDLFISVLRRERLISRLRPDLIHIFKPLPWTLIPAKLSKTRIVQDIDDAEYRMHLENCPRLNVFYAGLLRYMENNVSKWTGNFTAASKFFFELYWKKVTNICYLPNGVSLDQFSLENRESLRKVYEVCGYPLLMYTGVFEKCYHVDETLEIFALVKEEFKRCKLILVGEGPERKRLENLSRDLSISDSTVFTGHLNPTLVPRFLSLADVFIFPQEDNYQNCCRCPMKVREYMAAGKPIVASAVGEVEVALSDSQQLIEGISKKAFAERIIFFLKNPELSFRIGGENRKKVAEYTWQNLAKKAYQFYCTILQF